MFLSAVRHSYAKQLIKVKQRNSGTGSLQVLVAQTLIGLTAEV